MLDLIKSKELEFFSKKFNITQEDIINFVEYYNKDYSCYNNNIYEKVESRITHWLNYKNNDWFAERIDFYLNYLEKISSIETNRILLIDIGYSVPYLFARHKLTEKSNIFSILVDKESSAKEFFSALTDLKAIQRCDQDEVVVLDIENKQCHDNLIELLNKQICKVSPTHILIVASELIEHLSDPDNFWRILNKIKYSPTASFRVYITLPVGRPIPSHNMSFPDEQKVKDYLGTRLVIEEEKLLKPPKNVPPSPYLSCCVCAFGKPIRSF